MRRERKTAPPGASYGQVIDSLLSAPGYSVASLERALRLCPAGEAAIADSLRHGLASASSSSLSTGSAQISGPSRRPEPIGPAGPLQTGQWWQRDPHELLEASWDHMRRWRQRSQRPFERRDEQEQMAHRVLDAILAEDVLIIEAGTGIGKSMAYALPSVLVMALERRRIVISTYTHNLQQQLLESDLPEIWQALQLDDIAWPQRRRSLRHAKLLGRSNYVCRTALERALGRIEAEGGSLEGVALWLGVCASDEGSWDELPFGLEPHWLRQLSSHREICLGRRCRSKPACPVYQARERARSADLVVVNHSLLFADGRNEGPILGDFEALILDEAHRLDPVATEAFGVRLGQPALELLRAPLARMESEMKSLGSDAALASFVEEVREWLRRSKSMRGTFSEWLRLLDERLPAEHRTPSKQRYRDGDEVFGRVGSESFDLLQDLGQLVAQAHRLGRDCEARLPEEPRLQEAAELLELIGKQQLELERALRFLTAADDEAWVYYLQFESRTELAENAREDSLEGTLEPCRSEAHEAPLREIVALPLDVATPVQEVLLAAPRAVVYTSATLRVAGDSAYVRQRLGIESNVTELEFDSPFDYSEQCFLTHTTALGPYQSPDFSWGVADLLFELHRTCRRNILALFTSYGMLRQCQKALQPLLEPEVSLLTQEASRSRWQLAVEFAAARAAILLGTSSFWEGVDFPGSALEILVVTKLPFRVPTEPWVEARCEHLRARGEDEFGTFVLPDAVLSFRQGFGRLIRSSRDRGAIVLLDERLATREYAAAFWQSLPCPARHFESAQRMAEEIATFFEQEVRRHAST